MKNGSVIVAAVLSVFCLNATAQNQTTTSRIYLFNPDPKDVKNSIEALEASIKTRALRPAKKIGLVPSSLPLKPGEPVNKSFQVGPMAVNFLTCGDSYGEISTESSTSGGMMGSSGERFFGCMHLSQSGIRMSVILEQSTSSSSGLLGSLMTSIRDGIRGDDQNFGKQSFDKIVETVRQKVPGVLVELIELPGGDISRPDGDQVAQLMAKATPKADTPIAVTEGAANKQNIAQSLEARKQLLSMGLTYFSLEHFHEAILRKDTLAVQLYLQAGAVKPAATNAKGQTALELAKVSGDSEILAMVENAAK